MISALFAFFHFLAVFSIFAAVVLQWQTMSPAPTLAEARRIQTSDRVYGIFAVVVLVVGFLRVYRFEKGKAFYAANPFFQAKLMIVATTIDGTPMSLGGLGPLWAVYDADRIADFADKPLKQRFALSPWGLYLIEVKAS